MYGIYDSCEMSKRQTHPKLKKMHPELNPVNIPMTAVKESEEHAKF